MHSQCGLHCRGGDAVGKVVVDSQHKHFFLLEMDLLQH